MLWPYLLVFAEFTTHAVLIARPSLLVIARPKAVAIHAGIPADMDCRVASLLAVTKLRFMDHLPFRDRNTKLAMAI